MVRTKHSKPISTEAWLLSIGFMAAIASLTTLEYYNTSDSMLRKVQNLQQPQTVHQLNKAFEPVKSIALVTQAQPKQTVQAKRAIAAPKGWKTVQLATGVTAYVAPKTAEAVVPASDSSAVSAFSANFFTLNPLDGTRLPYVTEVSAADLLAHPVAPKRYVWQGVWQGEGYSRERDRDGSLISERERGNDIYLTLSYDATITNPKQPNLTITIESSQDRTGQLTNLSAFLYDSKTGKAIDRKDFEQLPPFYDVSLTGSGAIAKTEVKTLNPLGTVTFAYHLSESELQNSFPIELQAVNQFAQQRAQEIQTLEAQGWQVKEVPPPKQ